MFLCKCEAIYVTASARWLSYPSCYMQARLIWMGFGEVTGSFRRKMTLCLHVLGDRMLERLSDCSVRRDSREVGCVVRTNIHSSK